MNLHPNARTTPKIRAEIIETGNDSYRFKHRRKNT